MDDFMDEKTLLEEVGAGIQVKDGDELYKRMTELLNDQKALEGKGEAARGLVAANRGASKRYAALIRETLINAGKGQKAKG